MQAWQEIIVRWTARVVVGLFLLAWIARMANRSRREDTWSIYRFAWILGAAFLLLHDAVAFAFAHDWSHAAAYKHTADRAEALTGLRAGWGLYLNYGMTALWLADAAWLLWRPEGYRRRSKSIDLVVFVTFSFLVFNAAIVFATGLTRWMTAIGFAIIGAEWITPRLRLRSSTDP